MARITITEASRIGYASRPTLYRKISWAHGNYVGKTTLADVGIDRKLPHRAQKMAVVSLKCKMIVGAHRRPYNAIMGFGIRFMETRDRLSAGDFGAVQTHGGRIAAGY